MRRTLAIGLLCAAAFVLFHPPMWWGDASGVHRFPGWDLTRVFWADMAHARRALAHGELPWWNGWDRVGYPNLAEPQAAMFDPLTWLVVLVGVVIGGMPASLPVLKVVLCYGIAGAGMVALLRTRTLASGRALPPWAVAIGTLAWLVAPRLDKLKDQSALWPTAWAGWMLLAIERAAMRPTPWRGLWLGAVVGQVVCAGYPPAAFRLLLLAVPFSVFALLRHLPPRGQRRAYLRALAIALAIASVVIAASCAGQIVATLSVLPSTMRAGLSADDVTASRTILAHAWGAFAPLGSTTGLLIYAGFATAVGVVLAPCLAASRREGAMWLAIAVVGFVLACGDNTPVLPWLARLPGFSSFRIAGHYLTLSAIGFAVAAPLGLAALAEAHGRARVVVVLVAVAGLAIHLAWAAAPGPWSTAAVFASAIAVCGLAFAPPRWRARVGWALAGLLALDLFVAGRKIADILIPLPDHEPVQSGRSEAMLAAHDALVADPMAYRLADFGWVGDRIGPRAARRDLVGHRPALTDPAYLPVYRAALERASLLRAFNVGLVGYEKRPRGEALARDLVAVPGQPLLFTVRDPWPRAFATTAVTWVDDPAAAQRWLEQRDQPGAVVVRHGDAPAASTHAAAITTPARVVAESTGTMELEVELGEAALLVVAEAWAPHWRAWVDGEPAPIERVNLLQRGVWLGAGRHRVRMVYRPLAAIVLWWLWAATTAIVAALGVRACWRRRAAGR